MARIGSSLRSLSLAFLALALPALAQATPASPEGPQAPSLQSSMLEKGARPPMGGGTVGIRLSVSNIDPSLRSADFDLTMYTRGYGPASTTSGGDYVAYAGSPFFGYPALDYGDGSTIPTTTLALATSGGGPGGSNVYRSLASFSHVYPSANQYTASTGMACIACFRSSYVLFPPGSPVPTSFTAGFDLRPSNIIGNVPFYYQFSGTTYTPFLSSSVRYLVTYTPVITDTAQILIAPDVPTASDWSLLALAAGLAALGFLILRRS